MIDRYSRPEMANIWTEENKYRAWLEVEILADEAWAELGEIPKEDVALIREKADFDIDRILEIEQQTRHDVVAFTRAKQSASHIAQKVHLPFLGVRFQPLPLQHPLGLISHEN